MRGNDEVLVLRSLEYAVGCGACGVVALSVRVLAVGRLLKEGVHGGEALLHRDVYHLSLAGPESVEQCRHARAESVLAAYEVGDYNAGLHRRAVALAGHVHDAAARLSENVQAGVRRLGACLAEGGVELDDDFILHNREALFPPEPLRKIMALPDRPTAFFCTSDQAAVQLMQAFSQLGFRVPDDVSVLGFDDLPLATQVQPALTTLAQDISQKAHLVVDMLLRHIRQRALAPERTLLGTWLVERQSVRRLEPAGKQADQLLNPHETAIES